MTTAVGTTDVRQQAAGSVCLSITMKAITMKAKPARRTSPQLTIESQASIKRTLFARHWNWKCKLDWAERLRLWEALSGCLNFLLIVCILISSGQHFSRSRTQCIPGRSSASPSPAASIALCACLIKYQRKVPLSLQKCLPVCSAFCGFDLGLILFILAS